MNTNETLGQVELEFEADELIGIAKAAVEQGLTMHQFMSAAAHGALAERAAQRPQVRLIPVRVPPIILPIITPAFGAL